MYQMQIQRRSGRVSRITMLTARVIKMKVELWLMNERSSTMMCLQRKDMAYFDEFSMLLN